MPTANDPRELWRNQPTENSPVNVQNLVNRRTYDLYASTRSEILGSIAATVFFLSVMLWRFGTPQGTWQQVGTALAVVWIAATAYRFRRAAPSQAFTESGVEHYRAELLYRRDHLMNAWLWHGPVALALVVCAGSLPSDAPLRKAAPFLILLAVWLVIGILRRRREALQLDRELQDVL